MVGGGGLSIIPAIDSRIPRKFNLFKDVLVCLFFKNTFANFKSDFRCSENFKKAIKGQTDDKYILSLSMQVGTETRGKVFKMKEKENKKEK